MKKVITTFLFSAFLCLGARAQIFVYNDSADQERLGSIKATVLDSLTNEPVPFASVYVIPSKDTTITNFTLSDAKGVATLDEVPFGSYVFHVEMMGYKPFVKERYFRDKQVDMGTIRLQVDEQFLQAATITDVGNPIVVKKDTIEFNASSFRVGANAMLKDLILRMPGMEITEDGKVKFNGELIDKLTVGGRTFFFDDQSTALNNLPAAIVDKIRVIDRETESTRATGLEDGGKEKVMDVALKKEYEKGWFGNLGVKGGTTLGGAKDRENPLRDNRGLLYSGNALVSAYTEKDQVTVIANRQNVDDSGMTLAGIGEDGEFTFLDQGLSSATQFGFNANTSRIKDVETTVSVIYKNTNTDSGNRSDRTTYLADGDLNASTEETGKQLATALNANLEFQKEKGNVWFHIRPSFKYGKADVATNGKSDTFREGTFVNRSEKAGHSLTSSKDASLDADISFRNIGEKKGRTLLFSVSGEHDANSGESTEQTLVTTGKWVDERNMRYQSDGHSSNAYGSIRYTEPLGEKWSLSTRVSAEWQGRDNIRDAFDAAGLNDYYSSKSNNNYIEQSYDLTAQYKFGEDSWITLGGSVYGMLNENYSKTFGMENTVGKDEWKWYVAPTVRGQFSKGNDEVTYHVTGYGVPVSASRMQPVLNIADPSRLSMGNIYLKPYAQTYFSADWTRSNPEKFSTLLVYVFGNVNTTPISQALWYDANGIQYSIPVNARKPTINGTFMVDYTTPIDSKKNWFLSVSTFGMFGASTSYQAITSRLVPDKDSFDYAAFMADFWGNAEGDRFYSGQSGFGESRTLTINPYATMSLRYNQERWSFTVRAGTEGRVARYSLDPSVNMSTLDTRLGVAGTYTTKHEFEFNTDLTYAFYNGYSEGYGQPEWQWNAEINKSIGPFNLSVKMNDILNQTNNLTHTITANYQEDTYRLVMGRYILFGVKWNFGKMNAAHSQRAQQAARDMMW